MTLKMLVMRTDITKDKLLLLYEKKDDTYRKILFLKVHSQQKL
jgi:hypothetical protein